MAEIPPLPVPHFGSATCEQVDRLSDWITAPEWTIRCVVGHRRFGCEDLGLLVESVGGCARDNFFFENTLCMGGIGGVGEQYWPV